ncbi:MAG: UDP-N-acetylmuramoyl-tripeptide--D-alanyl-D-alanine ligase [Alphaproteobacteria bacterium]|nr:UDP-N-acetylmuramoyl-tripeptide--D-alanyl-D-alanine ligase [Alphaproteobacteria bacterium]MBV9694625.1 UDP-N-acetylmuramoyl-tripeptide--D-alanyl-D-alanine ligase [Alphaproteobacteria bacterium]
MSALWTSADAQAATLGHASAAFGASGISIDTRTLVRGDLFVALKDARDGHDFVPAAFAAGASAAMVSRMLESNGPLLTVANTLRGLEDLARAARVRSNAKIVAVTGSAGKTTTKEILRIALGALGSTHCSAASFNNHWGVPLSLASMPAEARYAVLEIGMNHFGEIRALVGMVRPQVALVTTIAPAHLAFFGSCEAIADAKSEIFEGLEAGGAALIPADSPYGERLAQRARQIHAGRVLRFGSGPDCDARLSSYDAIDAGARIGAEVFGTPVEFVLGAPGRHIAVNALAALLAVAVLEGDVLNAAAALKSFGPLKGRGARFSAGGIEVIDESYNANPASMAAALALLGEAKGRRIAVLGDMLEMGADAASHHASLAAPIEAARADLVFLCGPNMRALWDKLPASRRGGHALSAGELIPLLMRELRDGDVVLVKGSNGMKLSAAIDALKVRG